MNFKIYELSFNEGIHIGNGKLTDTNSSLHADTIFSALCLEALSIGGVNDLNRLVEWAENDMFKISDAMPFNRCESSVDYYIPKPMLKVEHGDNESSIKKKSFKKLKYININKLDEFLLGKLDSEKENSIINEMGKEEIRTMSSISDEFGAKPFPIGVYRFNGNWGLYIILQYKDEFDLSFVDKLFYSLSYTGIGGKRSSGLGKFTLNEIKEIPDNFIKRIEKSDDRCMTLSISLPEVNQSELMTEGSSYSLIKRSGFVSSVNYSNNFLKKKDSYVFASGSVFGNPFRGTILEVGGKGTHPVYRYLNPIFMEV